MGLGRARARGGGSTHNKPPYLLHVRSYELRRVRRVWVGQVRLCGGDGVGDRVGERLENRVGKASEARDAIEASEASEAIEASVS